jgi:hypothetical protein
MWTIIAAMMAVDAPAELMPGWMAGCWVQKSGESWTEECWTTARGGLMLGSGRSGNGEQIRDWEAMQIIRVDTDDPAIPKLTFYGMPKAEGRTPFQIVADGLPGVTFMNAEHDYPQRIRYWREGEELVAEVALKDGSKARRWHYRRPN